MAGGDSEAAVDALAGLAADALGVGRLAAAAVLLDRAAERHDRAEAPPQRQAIRLAWVGAPLALGSLALLWMSPPPPHATPQAVA